MTDERIIAYLLNELPEEETEQFEDECFAAEDWQEHLVAAEEELIDAYLRDELTPEQRQRFEQHYLTTVARMRRVEVAAALLRHVDTLPVEDDVPAPEPLPEPSLIERLSAFWGRQSWGPRIGVAVAVLAVVTFSWWLYRSQAHAPQLFATLTLNSTLDANRQEGVRASEVTLDDGVVGLRATLKLPEQAPAAAHYRVELLNEDSESSSVSIIEQKSGSVSVEIPAAQLARGRYSLRLFAVRPDGAEQRVPGNYLFNVR
jgi:hypothetical protein